MTKRLVIFNPSARGAKSAWAQQFLASKQAGLFDLVTTKQVGDSQRLAAMAVADGCKMVIAAGGDGTINGVINGIGVSGIPLGVLPLGTANVFARELGIPFKLDAALEVILRGRVRLVDLASARWGDSQRFFVQLAGVGLDAWAVRNVNSALKKKIGWPSYLWAGLKTVTRPRAHVEVRVNSGTNPHGKVREGAGADGPGSGRLGSGVLIGNGRFYGGRFLVFPKARIDDGRLDVCIFEKDGYLDMVRYFQGVLRGVHLQFKDVQYFQAVEVLCTPRLPTGVRTLRDGGVPFELDGEVAGEAPVRFSVVPRALKVIAGGG